MENMSQDELYNMFIKCGAEGLTKVKDEKDAGLFCTDNCKKKRIINEKYKDLSSLSQDEFIQLMIDCGANPENIRKVNSKEEAGVFCIDNYNDDIKISYYKNKHNFKKKLFGDMKDFNLKITTA